MAIIEERIRPLAFLATDCVPLDKIQLEQLRIIGTRLTSGDFRSAMTESFSIAPLPISMAAAKLRSFGTAGESVCAYWFSFREGIAIKWHLLIDHLADLWYPGSDDLLVVSMASGRLLDISHEEIVRIFSLARCNLE